MRIPRSRTSSPVIDSQGQTVSSSSSSSSSSAAAAAIESMILVGGLRLRRSGRRRGDWEPKLVHLLASDGSRLRRNHSRGIRIQVLQVRRHLRFAHLRTTRRNARVQRQERERSGDEGESARESEVQGGAESEAEWGETGGEAEGEK